MTAAPSLLQRLTRVSLVTQIVIGLIAGILLALLAPQAAQATGFTVLTTEFVIVGLLPSIARDLNVSVSKPGCW